jgi:hypothetical protein
MDSDRAKDLLNKAKALHFNVWSGIGVATTEQVAEFYEISEETVRQNVKRNHEEFEADGLGYISSNACLVRV